MTKSKVKAKNNDVVIIIEGVEHYINPAELIVGGETLEAIYNKITKLQDNVATLNNKISELKNYNNVQDARINDLENKTKDLHTIFENTIKEWLTR